MAGLAFQEGLAVMFSERGTMIITKGGIPQNLAETFTESVSNKATHFFAKVFPVFFTFADLLRTNFFTVQHVFPDLVTNDLASKPKCNSCM